MGAVGLWEVSLRLRGAGGGGRGPAYVVICTLALLFFFSSCTQERLLVCGQASACVLKHRLSVHRLSVRYVGKPVPVCLSTD